jgi:hypothetical protein
MRDLNWTCSKSTRTPTLRPSQGSGRRGMALPYWTRAAKISATLDLGLCKGKKVCSEKLRVEG